MNTRIPVSNLNLPGHRAPAAGYEAPFEMLAACHERVARMLRLMDKLQTHLDTKGWDSTAADAARDVMRYFDQAAPRHHEDEERHVFPAILARADIGLHGVVRQLQQDHLDMAAAWPAAREVLERVRTATADNWLDLTTDERAALAAYARLYNQHAEREDQLVFPAAQSLLDADAIQAMAADMMARRGVTITP